VTEKQTQWFDDDGDPHLAERWRGVEPSAAVLTRGELQARRIVVEQQLGLTVEWLEMLRARPVANGLLVAAAAAALLLMTPLGTLLTSLTALGS